MARYIIEILNDEIAIVDSEADARTVVAILSAAGEAARVIPADDDYELPLRDKHIHPCRCCAYPPNWVIGESGSHKYKLCGCCDGLTSEEY